MSSLEETRREFNPGKVAIKLGIDVHQHFYVVVVVQVGGSMPKPAQRFSKEAFLGWAPNCAGNIRGPRRWARPHFIHQSFFEYAHQSVLHCPWAKSYLQAQLARGKKHPTAVRALAFKWQRIMFKCWRDRVPYDEAIYFESLKRRGSPLAVKLTQPLAQAA